MNKLYNKIYNAVNEGIQKALLIDPEQNDVSINYSYHKINNKLRGQKYFNDIVKNFLDNPTKENYQLIIKNSYDGIYQYTVNAFNELTEIFNKISEITDNIDLSWIDTQNVLTFIIGNSELALNNIDNKEDIIFIKFNNIENLKHPIIIHKDLLIVNKLWSVKLVQLKQKQNKQTDGYENTKIIENEITNLYDYPAFKYCIDLKNNLKLTGYEAYLPAIEELKFLNENRNLINYILKYIKGTILYINFGAWWSSTQYSGVYAWLLGNGSSLNYIKNSSYNKQVLPFFAKIN